MVIIPDFIQNGVSAVGAALTGGSGIVFWPSAPEVWESPKLLGERALHVTQGVISGVAWGDICLS